MDCEARHPVRRAALLVEGDAWRLIDPADASVSILGVKAIGLLRVPSEWVPPFFVISGNMPATETALLAAANSCGITEADVYVRSNGTKEGLDERGALDSVKCAIEEVPAVILRMQESQVYRDQRGRQDIHFIVQARILAREQGHLSNERRLTQHPRDWRVEVDGGTIESLGVRRWRDASSGVGKALAANNRVSIALALRTVAAWILPCRAHFEWIWDGTHVWIVQLDFLPKNTNGVKPSSLVSTSPRPTFSPEALHCFSVAQDVHFHTYGKLRNASIYTELGYQMPAFFVMSDPSQIDSILQEGKISKELRRDLEALCAFPFVIRTDASGLAGHDRQMLPRSDELRSPQTAEAWLLGPFRDVMSRLDAAKDVALIGHHFLPATASAWAQAQPGERRVRIESLWGIPEGTYYFAHDVYDIDTAVSDIGSGSANVCRKISSRERYKAQFIAPNEVGEWIVQQTDESSDWAGSIRKNAWLQEIAWTTRRIAAREGKPVVVMWFVDLPKQQSAHEVLPWYHEKWEPVAGGYKKAAQRKKLPSAEFREVSGRKSWDDLRADVADGVRVERVFINPGDSEIVRDRQFVQELADHAKENGYVVELSGGLLSHAFYMLSKAGCNVECVDLFGVDEENIEFNKLVRDLIPGSIQDRGEQVEVVELTGDALIEALRWKIVEEVYEVADAQGADAILEEIADVQEVISGILKALGVDRKEVEKIQTKKRERRGGFNDGLMLLRTSLAPPLTDDVEVDTEEHQRRVISRQEHLPPPEQAFHVDRRLDISGIPERQLTMTLPAQASEYSSGTHIFGLANSDGSPHEMVFSAKVERQGDLLKLRVKLTNAAVQLDLPFTPAD